MASKPDEKNIFHSFSATSKKNWSEAAKLELNGADPFEKLSFTKDEIKIQPYYDRTDLPEGFSFSDTDSPDAYLGSRAWRNMPKINAHEPLANKKALDALNNGADGILFEITSDSIPVGKILQGIDLRYCSVSFLANDHCPILNEEFKRYHNSKSDSNKIPGAFFLKQNQSPDFRFFNDWDSFHPFGIVINESLPQQELNEAIESILRLINEGKKANWLPQRVFEKIAVMMPVSTDFFFSIAKLKALQIIWSELLSVHDVNETIPLPVHAASARWTKKEFQPHGNLLKSTTASLAAVLGGCSALTIEAEDNEQSMMTRIARNVSTILREESHLSKVNNPTAGSYYIDQLAHTLAHAALKKADLYI